MTGNAGRTTTTEALLGILSMGPMSGYEIRQLVSRSIGNFWSESFGQIYPALKRMLAEGLIALKDGAADVRAAKKVYALTDRGRERLKEWLELPVVRQVPRNELLLKLFFGDQSQSATMSGLVKVRRNDLAVDLARYEAIEKRLTETYAGNPALPFWLITVRYGKAEAGALLRWCDETVAELQGMTE